MERQSFAVRPGEVEMKKWYLVTYDIREAKRLRRVAKILEGYGERLQYSVFRVRVTEGQMQKLRWDITREVDTVDSVMYIGLCNACASKVISQHSAPKFDEDQSSYRIF